MTYGPSKLSGAEIAALWHTYRRFRGGAFEDAGAASMIVKTADVGRGLASSRLATWVGLPAQRSGRGP